MGVVDSLFFSYENVAWHAFVHTNWASFISKVNKGDADLEKISMNIL